MTKSLCKFQFLPVVFLALTLGSCQALLDYIGDAGTKDLVKKDSIISEIQKKLQDGPLFQYDVVQVNSDTVGDVSKDDRQLHEVFEVKNALNGNRDGGFEVYSGPVEVRSGESVNVEGYRFATGGRAFVLVDHHGHRLETGGLKLDSSSPLPKGDLTYKGFHYVNNPGQMFPYNKGKFLMSVNFAKGSGKIDSRAGDLRMWGGFSVNASEGKLSGKNMNVSIGDAGGKGDLSGRFHGPAGTGVSGWYETTISTTKYRGGIAGDRGATLDTPGLSLDDIGM